MRVNPEFLRRGYLKKQSQFAGSQIGVNSYMKGKYGKIGICGARKTKPIKANFMILQVLQGLILLFLDLLGPVLNVGFAHCNIGLYSHRLKRLVFADTKRTTVHIPDSSYTISCLCRFHIRDGIEKPIA